jgi:predicted GTPase
MTTPCILIQSKSARNQLVKFNALCICRHQPSYGKFPAMTAAPERRCLHPGAVLPAMGYSSGQLAALRASINAAGADVVVAGTPLDLAALLQLNKPVIRARDEFAEIESPGLWSAVKRALKPFLKKRR